MLMMSTIDCRWYYAVGTLHPGLDSEVRVARKAKAAGI